MNCKNCNSDLIGKDKRNKFCSKSCAVTFNNKLRQSKASNCLECNKSLRGTEKGRLFCSKYCQHQYKKKEKHLQIELGIGVHTERTLKAYLIHKHGEKCMECGWNKTHPITNKVPIELEHIDGVSENNNLENLKLLCPNCHSLTPTYRALNIGNGRKKRR